MDPAPMTTGDLSELERRLLEAARQDHVPDALSARMGEGLGLHVAGASLHGSLTSGAKVGAPLFTNAGLWGFLSLALVAAVAGWHVAQPGQRAAPSQAATEQAATEQTAAASGVVTPAPPEVVEINAAPSAPQPAPPPPASRAISAAASVRSLAASDDASLRAEIALLDRARSALRDGSSARAMRLLDQHRQRFARAALAPEAAALRIEALVQRGSHAQAGSMSQHFMTAYPSHPLREHVAKLTAPESTRRLP